MSQETLISNPDMAIGRLFTESDWKKIADRVFNPSWAYRIAQQLIDSGLVSLTPACPLVVVSPTANTLERINSYLPLITKLPNCRAYAHELVG